MDRISGEEYDKYFQRTQVGSRVVSKMNSIYLTVVAVLLSGSSLQALVLCGTNCSFEVLSRNKFNEKLDQIYWDVHKEAPPPRDSGVPDKPIKSSKLIQVLTPIGQKNPQDCAYDYYEYGSEEQSQLFVWEDSCVTTTTNRKGLIFEMDVRRLVNKNDK